MRIFNYFLKNLKLNVYEGEGGRDSVIVAVIVIVGAPRDRDSSDSDSE